MPTPEEQAQVQEQDNEQIFAEAIDEQVEKPEEKLSEEKPKEKGIDPDEETGPEDKPKEEKPAKEEKADPMAELMAEIKALKEEVKTLREKPKEEKPAEESEEDAIPEDLQEYYKEFPEARRAAQFEAERLIKKMGVGKSDETAQAIGQMRFEQTVINGFMDEDGSWVDGHPDAMKILTGPAWKKFDDWAKTEKIDPMTVTDPREAIKVIGKYKTSLAAAAAADKKGEQTEEAKRLTEQAGGSLKGGTRDKPAGGKAAQSEDPDAIFEEALAAKK